MPTNISDVELDDIVATTARFPAGASIDVRWHGQGFRYDWRWKSRHRDRPKTDPEIRELIRRMCRANPKLKRRTESFYD